MASPDLIHLEDLLAPIDGENPCGQPLRYDPAWDDLASARRGRTDAVTEGADVEPEWPRVQAVAIDLLASRTKDLQVCGWLTEALIHTSGYAGLRDGLRLLHGLCERYWDSLHPEFDEADPEVRAAPLIWLTDAVGGAQLPGLLRAAPIALASGSGETFSLASKQSFQARTQRDGEDDYEYQSRVREAQDRSDQYQQAITATPDTFYADLRDDLAVCLDEVNATERLIDEKLGVSHAPSWSAIREVLGDAAAEVGLICRARGIGVENEAIDGTAAADGGSSHAGNGRAGASGPIRTRGEAVARLRDVVEFYKQTEPHSPVAHLVARAVRWSSMPLESILAEMIQDQSALTRIWDTLGVHAPESNE